MRMRSVLPAILCECLRRQKEFCEVILDYIRIYFPTYARSKSNYIESIEFITHVAMIVNKSFVTDGFKEDCEQLIARFENVEDIRFETFCEIWQDMKFSLVFAYHSTLPELMEFCEEALYICKQFLFLSSRFKERIAGLYLLYGIYYKMPINTFKIKIKFPDWQSIIELHNQIKEGEHLDTNYILSKLITDNAFHFSAFDCEFGLEKYFRRKKRQCRNPYSLLPAIKEITEQDELLTSISTISKLYCQRKCALSTTLTGVPSLNLFNLNIVDDIINEINAFTNERRISQTPVSNEGTKNSE